MIAAAGQDLCPDGQPSRRANEWLSRAEVKSLTKLLGLPVSSARLHLGPRKRMQKPGNKKGAKSRVSVLLGREPGVALLVYETAQEVAQHPRRRSPFEWRGLTLFLESKGKQKEPQGAYVAMGPHVYEAKWPEAKQRMWEDFVREEARSRRACEIFLLRMKANGKELDPKFFDEKEKASFGESDRAEWQSWIDNKVVELVPPDKARWVRTNKAKEVGMMAKIVAKSRIVIPGHLDPGLGEFRTDSPTTTPAAVRILKTLAVSRRWKVYVFDVSTAFLSGKATEREVYIRGPEDGLPATTKTVKIQPYALMRVLKSAYGLAKAPRLWYLQAAQYMVECGMEELEICRATFVKAARGMCTLHVDDGLLAGQEGCPVFKEVLAKVNQKFNIKEWKVLGPDPVQYLGSQVTYHSGTIVDSMKEYILKIKPMKMIKAEPTELLGKVELKAYRSAVMQMRWPCQHCLPEKLFEVSQLAQKVSAANWGHVGQANKLLQEIRKLATTGQAELRYRPIGGEPMMLSFFDASLGKSEVMRAQQGQVHLVASKEVLHREGVANILGYRSGKIAGW